MDEVIVGQYSTTEYMQMLVASHDKESSCQYIKKDIYKMAEASLSDPINTTGTLVQAQTDMCKGYANGSIGIIVSGFIWLISATVSYQYTADKAVWTLLIGGIIIHPVSILFYKIIGLSGNHSKGNRLGNLGMEGTIFMIMCIPIAFGLSLQHVEWFFQGMLLIIGGRYLTFSSIYGIKLYWILGAILGLQHAYYFTLA